MTNLNASKLSEVIAVVGKIDPDVTTAGTVLTEAIDMAKYTQVMAIVQAGTLGTNATVNFKFTQATTSGGTYKDVTGAAITEMTQAGTDQSDRVAVLNMYGTELDMDSDYRYVKGSLTIGTATSDAAAVVVGLVKEGLATDRDSSTVDHIA